MWERQQQQQNFLDHNDQDAAARMLAASPSSSAAAILNDFRAVGQEYGLINIAASQPPWLARPIYGIATPIVVFVTLITNTLIVVVLSHRHLRTPTNFILLCMAIAELLTGLASIPWFLYYYLLGGMEADGREGLSEFWCRHHYLFAVHLPTIFHTVAIWLTVFLAVQRYVYVCIPARVMTYCNMTQAKRMVALIMLASVLVELPWLLNESTLSVLHSDGKRHCYRVYSPWVNEVIGRNTFMATLLSVRALFVHIVPCVLLVYFTSRLFGVINDADRRRGSCGVTVLRKVSASGQLCTSTLMNSTTRMLIVVLAIFLLIEIPVALIFLLHLFVVVYQWSQDYALINILVIIRNFMIILTYPLNFAIYFGMSSTFRLQFRQLFTKQVLYVAAPTVSSSPQRPRFSIQLIAIHKLSRQTAILRAKVVNHHIGHAETNHFSVSSTLRALYAASTSNDDNNTPVNCVQSTIQRNHDKINQLARVTWELQVRDNTTTAADK